MINPDQKPVVPIRLGFQVAAPAPSLSKVAQRYGGLSATSIDRAIRFFRIPDNLGYFFCVNCHPQSLGQPRLFLAGMRTMPGSPVPIQEDVTGFAVYPDVIAAILGDRADLIVNQRIDLRDRWGGDVDGILLRLRACSSHLQRKAMLENLLAQRLAQQDWQRAACAGMVREAIRTLGNPIRLDKDPDDMRTVDAIGRWLGIAPRQLHRAFIDVTGLAPKTYLALRHIRWSMQKLADGHHISATALSGGFSDQAHFTKVFHRIVGITPGQFRAGLMRGTYGFEDGLLVCFSKEIPVSPLSEIDGSLKP